MKKISVLLSFICLLFMQSIWAQEKQEGKALGTVVNTLKEHLTLEGYAQVGYSYDDSGNEKTNSFDIKRAILMLRGKITDRWSCYFSYNFANTGKILEVYTEYTFLPQLTVRVGQFKTMFTFENPMSPCSMELINVYSQATNYLAGYNGSDPLYGSNAGRDLGLMIYGDLFKNRLLSYKLAVMNGQGINKKDGNNQKDIVGTLLLNPLHWLSVGGTFSKGKGCAVAVSDINPEIGVGDNYTRNRWSVGAIVKSQYLDLRTEYLQGKDGHVKSEGFYATLSAHVLPRFDVVASYDYFDKNRSSNVDEQTNYVAGVQWWFYPKCRLQLQYTYCNRHHADHSNLLQTQIQVRF